MNARTPLLESALRAIDHRVIWWLLAHQMKTERGVATGTVPRGWRVRAMAELEIGRHALFDAEQRLKSARIIEAAPFQRNVRLRGDAFEMSKRADGKPREPS